MINRIYKSSKASLQTLASIAVALVIALVFTIGTPTLAEKGNEYAITPDDLQVVGSDISGISTFDIHGESVSNALFSQSNFTILHFFSTWLPDVIRELSYMQNALDDFGENGVAVYGLLYEDTLSTIESCDAMFAQFSITYNCLRLDDVLNSLVSIYPYIPQTFIVNSDGVVASHFPGTFQSAAQLEALIEQQLNNPTVFHKLRFMDGCTGELIKLVNVVEGANAVPPEPPEHPGYEFSHWQGSFENVTEERTVTAVYTQISHAEIPGDVDCDGVLTVSDALSVLRNAIGVAFNEDVFKYGDIDEDGTVTVVDAMLILRYATGVL